MGGGNKNCGFVCTIGSLSYLVLRLSAAPIGSSFAIIKHFVTKPGAAENNSRNKKNVDEDRLLNYNFSLGFGFILDENVEVSREELDNDKFLSIEIRKGNQNG